ncbi:hypothetical protein AHAS_Ahas19G0232000 [Arachis hypogaea]
MKQQKKGHTRSKRVVLDDEEEELDGIPPQSTTRTSASTGYKFLLYRVVKDILQKFVNLSNHLISTSQQAIKLSIRNENTLRKSRDRVEVLLKYVDNIHEDDTMATDQEESLDTEDEGLDA